MQDENARSAVIPSLCEDDEKKDKVEASDVEESIQISGGQPTARYKVWSMESATSTGLRSPVSLESPQLRGGPKTISKDLSKDSFPSLIATAMKELDDVPGGKSSRVSSDRDDTLKILKSQVGIRPKELIKRKIAECLLRMSQLVYRSSALDSVPQDFLSGHSFNSEKDMETLDSQVVKEVGDYVQKLLSKVDKSPCYEKQ